MHIAQYHKLQEVCNTILTNAEKLDKARAPEIYSINQRINLLPNTTTSYQIMSVSIEMMDKKHENELDKHNEMCKQLFYTTIENELFIELPAIPMPKNNLTTPEEILKYVGELDIYKDNVNNILSTQCLIIDAHIQKETNTDVIAAMTEEYSKWIENTWNRSKKVIEV